MVLSHYLLVAAGGALGAVLRFWVSQRPTAEFWTSRGLATPWSILLINVAGCFLFGLLQAWTAKHGQPWRFFLLTGVLGGFTTFSSFGWDTWLLFSQGRYLWALGNALASVALGVTAVGVGVWLTRG